MGGELIASENLIKVYLLQPIQQIFGTNEISKKYLWKKRLSQKV